MTSEVDKLGFILQELIKLVHAMEKNQALSTKILSVQTAIMEKLIDAKR